MTKRLSAEKKANMALEVFKEILDQEYVYMKNPL